MTDKIVLNKKGFTLVEIIAAALIISITAGGTLTAYLYARQFSDKFLHRSMATKQAQAIADYIRYGLAPGYKNTTDLVNGTTYGGATHTAVTDSTLKDLIDASKWNMYGEVDNLAAEYTVSDVWFDNNGIEKTKAERDALVLASNPSMPVSRPAFKKIAVKVTWDNRRAV